MQFHSSMRSKSSDTICTPPDLLRHIHNWHPIGLDPCSNMRSLVDARIEYSLEDGQNGLEEPWQVLTPHEIGYINPPFSDIGPWFRKGDDSYQPNTFIRRSRYGKGYLFLTLSDPTTEYFNFAWHTSNGISLCKKRIKFVGMKSGASFQCMFVYYGPDKSFAGHFGGELGYIVR